MIGWIMECVTSTSFSLSINSYLHGYFKGKRDLRQGDPLSPYLFTLVMEVLMLMLKRRARDSDFSYHRYCSKLNIINLCFADDFFLFAHGDKNSSRVIMDSLEEFKNSSGLTPSLPKSGLGIRRLEAFNMAFITSHIWSLLTCKESLWVKWIHTYKLNGRSFWEILLRALVSAWFDNWCALSPLSSIVSNHDIYTTGFRLDSKVHKIIDHGSWSWLNDWASKCPSLVNITVPYLSNEVDCLTWRNLANVESDFLVAKVWDCILPRSNEVDWFHVVRFSHQIPRHAILLWLVIKRKLKTQDTLRQWDVGSNTNLNLLHCPLCETQPDSHDHLFFDCRFSLQLAKKAFKERENLYLDDIVDLEENLSSHDRIVYKMGQSIQTIHMLGKTPNKVYDLFLKAGLGYQNPERIKKAIAAQPNIYHGEMLYNTKLKIDSPDFEKTLEDAEESRLKMRKKMVQLNYEKLIALYETFVPKKEPSVEQTYFSFPTTSNECSKSNDVMSDFVTPPDGAWIEYVSEGVTS
ncbi:putative reverse transcriptase domain, reverse transcriptase zinc-binding domain protein [Tanacetum coccineum]